ncbi:Cytosolic 5'-nucleotidase 1A [Dissostichus eleginoides]|uniref:Cytosolic 5'-nucleotidase 1A n=1 Tax=Dissostichus eleginoides TaxID=100907 RepID=A0AAD9F4G2_DISEL|nr:Cytosolic 5'-nucleotidase 1A [Dissostichus eleginoides]KAK1888472.1 Cytosolic 5'-nucleotidase 1A [Dissostichus eleginoides]
MVSTIQNTDVKQKEADRAVVVAVTSRAVFDCGVDDGDEVCEVGVAFPLLQVLQRVNERLEISRFCFSSEEDFTESLLKNNVHLFLTTDRDEAAQASQKGVFSALLNEKVASSEQLRVVFCEDAVIRTDTEPPSASQDAAQSFWAQLGEMRRRFGVLDSPLSLLLLTSRGGRESCGAALQTLRSRGLNMDEAYCLAGAPRSPILSLLRPHFLLINHLED